MNYRRAGRSGILLPEISLGLWQNFGDAREADVHRDLLRCALDHGITHLDLANNYGPPPGAAEENFGRALRQHFAGQRDELFLSTKAGHLMWPGPYGDGGSRKHLLSSLDQSLRRMGVDYVDIFYHHRPDPDTPLEESMEALAYTVQSGRALYVGLSKYPPHILPQAVAILHELGIRPLLHQFRYSLLERGVEEGSLAQLTEFGMGGIAFSPLAQGQLTGKYLAGKRPSDARASRADCPFLKGEDLEQREAVIHALHAIAQEAGISLTHLALCWLLQRPEISSVLLGARTVPQLIDCLAAREQTALSEDILAAIDNISAS